MQRSSQGARYLILEMALITFAVVLGFAVSNWDVARKEKRRSRVAVERIRLELERNVSGLATAMPYYIEMSERLDSILGADGDARVADVTIAGWQGLHPPTLRTASFQVAVQTGALERVEFPIVDQIALAYEVLGDFSASVDHALSTLISGNLTRVSEWQTVFSLLGELSALARRDGEQVLGLLTP